MNSKTAFDPAVFRESLGYYPTGVVVITAVAADGKPAGMVVGSFTSVSLDPPLVAYLPTRESRSYQQISSSKYFCVNILAADQQDLCRKFAARGADKFEGVSWAPAENGSPVLDGAIGWIECSVEHEYEGGDHMIVVGRVLDLRVERRTLPLVFFQGGYGRFALPSPVSGTDPELLETTRLAETFRKPLEDLADEVGAAASIMVRSGNHAVFVAAKDHGEPGPSSPVVGHQVPLVPPVGTVFYAHAPQEEVDEWLARAYPPGEGDERFLQKLRAVQERGYSVSLAPSDPADRMARLEDYSGTDVLPEHDRRVREMISASADLYEPDLVEGETYDLHSVIVPVPTDGARTRMVIRLSRLPKGVDAAQVKEWATALEKIAALPPA